MKESNELGQSDCFWQRGANGSDTAVVSEMQTHNVESRQGLSQLGKPLTLTGLLVSDGRDDSLAVRSRKPLLMYSPPFISLGSLTHSSIGLG